MMGAVWVRLQRISDRYVRRIPRRYLRRMPRRLAVPVFSAAGWPRYTTEDHRLVTVPEPYRLEVYWLCICEDTGPAYSLFHRTDELLRVDLLGSCPHIHYNLAESRYRDGMDHRVYLPPAPMDSQIDRAVFELAHNVPYCNGLHRNRAIRTRPIDQEAFAVAATEVGRHLRALAELHGG